MCNCMWFIRRARKRYRTRKGEEGTCFREARWQRMNSPIGFRGIQKDPAKKGGKTIGVRGDEGHQENLTH